MRDNTMRSKSLSPTSRIRPTPMLARYMSEKLQLEKKKIKAKAGGEALTDKEVKRLDAIRTDKKRILQKIIFPSMANLIFFFESMNMEPILEKTFVDEQNIEDLLGIRRNSPSFENYGIFFTRLLQSIISGIGYNNKDYRIRLIHEAHKIIHTRMNYLVPFALQRMRSELSDFSIRTSRQDIERALAWTEIMSKDVEDPYQSAFSAYFEEGNREKFANIVRTEAPNKTIDVDTKTILQVGF